MKIIFEKGDKVKVTEYGNNASTVTPSNVTVPFTGVYSLPNWRKCLFTVAGDYESITFDFSPDIYGAYPLLYRRKLIGYVYNTALTFIK